MFFAHIVRSRAAPAILRMGLAGGLCIALAWWTGGERWTAVLTSLMGLAISGAVVWYVRIVGGWAMNKEAMGFGDVTLMAMIGAFLGWQAGVLVFFLAPIAAIGVSVVRLLVWRDRSLPFGPYLCLASLGLMVGWPHVWAYIESLRTEIWLVPISLGACMVLLGPLMVVARLVTDAIAGPEDAPPTEPAANGPTEHAATAAPNDPPEEARESSP
jgi:Flp pilus assembly protein protease CpaA